MKEPAPPMPGSYLAVWIAVMVMIGVFQQYQTRGDAALTELPYTLAAVLPHTVVAWLLAKASWPSYWRGTRSKK